MLLGRRILLLSVTDDGRESFTVDVASGEFFGVMFLGAGSFDRAECTRSSIFCILPRRFLI